MMIQIVILENWHFVALLLFRLLRVDMVWIMLRREHKVASPLAS